MSNSTWQHFAESHKSFALAMEALFSLDKLTRVQLIKSALKSKDRAAAIYLLQYLDDSDLVLLFEEIVFLVSFSHGALATMRKTILAMPRDWVLKNIEGVAEKFLENGTYDEYRRFLELYIELDQNMAYRLAQRARQSRDSDIKEAGEDFLSKLSR